MIRTRHPGHPTRASGSLAARLAQPKHVSRAKFRVTRPFGTPRPGHAAPGALVESAGAKSPTAALQTVSTSLSSCACGGGAAHWANLRPTWPAALLSLDAGRFQDRHVGPASEAERVGDRRIDARRRRWFSRPTDGNNIAPVSPMMSQENHTTTVPSTLI